MFMQFRNISAYNQYNIFKLICDIYHNFTFEIFYIYLSKGWKYSFIYFFNYKKVFIYVWFIFELSLYFILLNFQLLFNKNTKFFELFLIKKFSRRHNYWRIIRLNGIWETNPKSDPKKILSFLNLYSKNVSISKEYLR